MKTSIIISTVAAVSLMITFAETPMNRDAQFNKETLYNNISYIPAKSITTTPEVEFSAYTKADGAANTKVDLSEDFSYLKFNVANYTEANEVAAAANEENFFGYLKFNVNDYAATEDESIETPVNEFEYLKFNVNDYSANENAESIESPANEFEYLKFNVNDYSANENDESIESPVDEFDYLKFNVNNYKTTDNNETFKSPANEFDYLKFDVNRYSSDNLSSGHEVELPVTER